MDLDKIKKSYDWDPSKGDYSKNHVSYERKLLRKKQMRNFLLLVLYLILLIAAVIIFNTIE